MATLVETPDVTILIDPGVPHLHGQRRVD